MSIKVTYEMGSGHEPRIVRIITSSTLTELLVAGWLKLQDANVQPSDKVLVYYDTDGTPGNAFFDVAISAGVITLSQSEADVTLPTILNHIAVYSNTGGGLSEDAATAINGGNLQAGLSATAGYLASFPGTAAKGSLLLKAIDNTGDTLVTLSNALHGQASVYSIPDGGQATAELIISDSAGTQNITSGALQVDAGALSSGLLGGGFVGLMKAWPTTTLSGFVALQAAVNATGDFGTTISNAVACGQAQVVSIPDVGGATGSFLVSSLALADLNANVVNFNVTVGQAALASAALVVLINSTGAKQYKIIDLVINSGGTNFSGGGGDRLGQVSDGTTVYSVVPAASLGTLANGRWGDTAMAFPASAAINVSTVAGANLSFSYSGGASDYTAGSVVISGTAIRVA